MAAHDRTRLIGPPRLCLTHGAPSSLRETGRLWFVGEKPARVSRLLLEHSHEQLHEAVYDQEDGREHDKDGQFGW